MNIKQLSRGLFEQISSYEDDHAVPPARECLHSLPIGPQTPAQPTNPRLRLLNPSLPPTPPRSSLLRPLPRPSPAAPRSRHSALVTRSVFERFTERCIQGILMAQHEARKTSSSEVSSEHILLGLVMEDQKRTKGTSFMGATLSAETVRDAVRQLYGPQASSGSGGGGSGGSSSPAPDSKPPTDAPFSTEAKAVFECALRESRKMNMSYIAPEHILVALLASGDKVRARRVIVALHMDPEAMKAEAMRRVAESSEAAAGSGASGGAAAQGAPGSGAAAPKKAAHKPKVKQDALEEFCLDLVLLALGNRIDQVIGRDEEIGRVIQILARRTKHNVVLLGEPGVGKTAIAEGEIKERDGERDLLCLGSCLGSRFLSCYF